MRILLDTQVFLWMVSHPTRLSARARRLIADVGNDLFLSLASTWEMAIKISLGKLKLKESLESFIAGQLQANSIRQLDINFRHVTGVADLPFHHRDPFDRLLVSQVRVEDLQILSADTVFDRYKVRRQW